MRAARIMKTPSLGREPGQQAELDRDQRGGRVRQRQPGQAQQVDVEAGAAERHRQHRDAVDQREAGEADAAGEPEGAELRREVVVEVAEPVHRVADVGVRVERHDERVLREDRRVVGHDQLAVDAEPAAEAGDEERRRAADRAVDRTEDEERRVVAERGVAAEDAQAVDAEPAEQHADVAGVALDLGLEQSAGQDHAAHVGGDRQPHQVDRPGVAVEHVAAEPVDRELLHRRRSARRSRPGRRRAG